MTRKSVIYGLLAFSVAIAGMVIYFQSDSDGVVKTSETAKVLLVNGREVEDKAAEMINENSINSEDLYSTGLTEQQRFEHSQEIMQRNAQTLKQMKKMRDLNSKVAEVETLIGKNEQQVSAVETIHQKDLPIELETEVGSVEESFGDAPRSALSSERSIDPEVLESVQESTGINSAEVQALMDK